ncbi:fimbrillin family protein [Dysgonomonas sp. ZJ709]|uniref:fimbrillin family protein n=1 Tax=Dysgonomonas sp. ZJ709 TaxID=2709797 RepID=UPI0013EB690B|nr:fimbrillin family protein [Dysgonomonas sp. ZJ709]
MKSLFYLRIILYTLICLLYSSCQKDEEQIKETITVLTNEVRFNLPISTRSTDTQFSVGDEIGVYAVERYSSENAILNDSANYADNKRFRFNGTTFEAYSDSDTIIFPQNKVLDFYVYYPYTVSIENPTSYYFEVQRDQSNYEDYTGSDLLFAHNTEGINNRIVTLEFIHKIALVETTFYTGKNKKVRQAVMKNRLYSGRINIATGNYTVHTAEDLKSDIQMLRFSEDSLSVVYRVLMPSQAIKNGDLLFVFDLEDGQRSYQATSSVNPNMGAKNTFDFALQYKVETTASHGGTVSKGGVFDCGKTIQIYATPEYGYQFDGWFENGQLVSVYEYYSFIVDADRKLEARFSVQEHEVMIYVTSGGIASFDNEMTGGIFKHGEECHIFAQEKDSYRFVGYFENEVLIHDEFDYNFPVTQKRAIEVRFEPLDVYVKLDFLGLGIEQTGEGSLAYGSAKVVMQYFKENKWYDYTPESEITVYVSFRVLEQERVSGTDIGYKIHRYFKMKQERVNPMNVFILYYWQFPMISSNRMNDLTDIYNLRLDTSDDTGSRKYIFNDKTVTFYRMKPWNWEEYNEVIKIIQNKNTTIF